MADLSQAVWMFYTHDQNKDGNTWLGLYLYTAAKRNPRIAYDEGTSGNEWAPWTPNGPIRARAQFAFGKSDYSKLLTWIQIKAQGFADPGRDTWTFDFHLRLYWDDGTMISRKKDNCELSSPDFNEWRMSDLVEDDWHWGDWKPSDYTGT